MRIIFLTTALSSLIFHSAYADGMPETKDGLEIKIGGEFDAQAGFRSQKDEYVKATSTGMYVTALSTGYTTASLNVFKRGVTPGNNSVGINTSSLLHLNVKNKTHDGLTFGANIGIDATTRSTSSKTKELLDRSYIYMESDIGRLEFGSNESAASAMRLGADRIARATGGVDGDWDNYVVLDTFNTTGIPGNNQYDKPKIRSSNFIMTPGLLLENIANSGLPTNMTTAGNEKSRKLTFFTPEYNGFQAGISFIPDTRNTANTNFEMLGVFMSSENASYGQYYGPSVKNAVSGGVSWEGNIDKNQSIKISLVGEAGKASAPGPLSPELSDFNNVKDYVLGAQWNYQEFSFATSYGYQGKSLVNKRATNGQTYNIDGVANTNQKFASAKFWTFGGAWNREKWGISLTYMGSRKNSNKFSLLSLGADYEIAPGLMPYAEISTFKMTQKNDYWDPLASRSALTTTAVNSTSKVNSTGGNYANDNYKNKGTALILGMKINF